MSVRFGTSDTFFFSWRRFQEHAGPLIGALLLATGICAVPYLVYFVTTLMASYQWLGAIFYLVGLFLELLLSMGLTMVGLKIADKQAWGIEMFTAYAKRFLPYLGGVVLYGLITAGGFFLLVLPGIYWATRFSFWTFFVLEKGQGPVEALKSSWALTQGAFWDIFALRAAYACIVILSVIPFGLGLLITIPMQWIVQAYMFRQLEKHPYAPVA